MIINNGNRVLMINNFYIQNKKKILNKKKVKIKILILLIYLKENKD